MLDALRRASNSWVLKPLMLILAIAFVLWGISGVFSGIGQSNLATVGKFSISPDEYQRTYNIVLENLARRYGRRPTAEEARQNGLDRAVLDELINAAAIDNSARDLNLALPMKAVVDLVQKDPNFQSPAGTFDAEAFNKFLRESGYSERGWLDFRRREEVRRQLTESMFEDMPVPTALIDLVNTFREETRTIQYFTIAPDKVVKIGEPDEAQLKATYDGQQRRFVTPEMRHLGALVLSGEAVKAKIAVSDEDIKKTYEIDKDAQTVPERRRILQIPFKDAAAAAAAAAAIKGGKKFEDLAKEQGASESDIDLGIVTKPELLDPKIADAAFALKQDEVSAPVAGKFTTVLLKAAEVLPGRTRSFDEMKQEIRDKIAAGRLNEELRKLRDSVEDGRSAGKSLKEIAASIGVSYVEIPATDRGGRKPDGTPAYEGMGAAQIITAGFGGKTGVEGESVDLPDGGEAWVDVLGVTPERQRPLEEIKDDVKALWKDLEQAKQISEAATKLIERAGKGEKLAALAAEVGGKLETSKPFKRAGEDAGVPPPAVQRAFSLALGGVGAVELPQAKTRMILRLVDIKKPEPPSKEAAEQMTQQLRQERQRDAFQAFVVALRERYGASFNEATFRQLSGADTNR